MADALALFDRYGVALCLLVALGLSIRKLALWAGPRFDRLIDAHVGFVNTTGEQVVKQTACLETLAGNQQAHGEMLTQIHKKVHEA